MYNEINILTMSDEEIKIAINKYAREYNINVNHAYLSRSDDGYLSIFIEPTEDAVSNEFENKLLRYVSGITDIAGNIVGSNTIDCPCVVVFNLHNKRKYEKIHSRYSNMQNTREIISGAEV